jgi:hypothetical protein
MLEQNGLERRPAPLQPYRYSDKDLACRQVVSLPENLPPNPNRL